MILHRKYRKYLIGLLLHLLCSCFHMFPAFAWNQLPLLTESPNVLPAGGMQIELGLQYLSKSNFPFSLFSKDYSRNVLSCPTLGFQIGLGGHAELQLAYEILFIEEEEALVREPWQSGDLAFFTKIEILREQRIAPGWGMRIGAKLPNAGDHHRVGTDETDLAFSSLFEKTFAHNITTTANLGLLILGNPFENATQDDLLSYAIACKIPWRESMTYTAEVVGQAFGTSHNERASALLHVHIQDGNLTWNLSGRVGLLENSEEWGISGGVRWTFHL